MKKLVKAWCIFKLVASLDVDLISYGLFLLKVSVVDLPRLDMESKL